MESLSVAIVSLDPAMRLAAARAFDRAPAGWNVTLHRAVPDDADVVVLTPDVDGEGVRFDPARPERVLDDVAAATRPGTGAIVVTGASGGLGATSIAVHLAAALGRRWSTCLFDLGANGGLRRRLGLPSDVPTWAQVGDDDDSLRLAALPVAPGVRACIEGSDDDRDPGPVLRRVVDAFERVVVDARSECVGPALVVARAGVLVAAPTFPSVELAGEMLVRHPLRWALVTNRLGPGGEATESELEARLGRPIGLELPCAPRLRDAEDDRRLLNLTWSRWGRRIERLAAALGEP